MKYCTVMGSPIEHSISPKIHALFAKQTGIDLDYSKTLVPADNFAQAVNSFKNSEGLGANITVPLKELAYKFVGSLTERASLAGAVNTLYFTADGVLGDNTDGVGLVTDLLENLKLTLQNKKVLVVGAGGAARGILAPLLDQGCQITLANRTLVKAEIIADLFKHKGLIKTGGLTDIEGQFDLVINATAASLSGKALPLDKKIMSKETVCYDLMYAKEPTIFMEWATKNGATKVYDGLGMLVGQAAHSFDLWHGVMPDIKTVLTQLRSV